MAQSHRDRLLKKYGARTNRQLLTAIIAENTARISRAVARLSKDNYDAALKRVTRRGERKLVLPDISEVIPKRSVFVNKATERGAFLSENLRRGLSIDLRNALHEFKTKSGQQAFVRRTGAKAGTINPALVKDFRRRIQERLASYSRRDRRFGVPSNANSIAVTEARTAIDITKHQYAARLVQQNADRIEAAKRWVHNAALSRQPRPHHKALNGTVVAFDETFDVQGARMRFPHDPQGPVEQIVNCHCDYDVIIRRKD